LPSLRRNGVGTAFGASANCPICFADAEECSHDEDSALSGKAKDPERQLVQAGLLLDVYGDLLTERQRTFMRLHFEEDLSFSDIAREHQITRQAVHDSVKHAMGTLRTLEQTLGLVEKNQTATETHVGGQQLIGRLAGLRDRIDNECRCDHTASILAELNGLIALLKGNPVDGEDVAIG
jgi:uncharacterized protein